MPSCTIAAASMFVFFCANPISAWLLTKTSVVPHSRMISQCFRETFLTSTSSSSSNGDTSSSSSSIATSSSPSYSLVTLDSTDTLISLRTNVGEIYRNVLAQTLDNDKYHYSPLPHSTLFTKSFKKAFQTSNNQSPNYGTGTLLSSEDWWRNVVFQTFDDVLADQDWYRTNDHDQVLSKTFDTLYHQVFVTEESWKVRPGVTQALQDLAEWKQQQQQQQQQQQPQSRYVAVLSNFDERLSSTLRNVLGKKDFDLFDAVLTSRELGVTKPDPLIFQKTMARFGVTDPETCLHVGNTHAVDIVGSSKAGWHGAYVPHKQEEITTTPTMPPKCYRLDNISDLVHLLTEKERTQKRS